MRLLSASEPIQTMYDSGARPRGQAGPRYSKCADEGKANWRLDSRCRDAAYVENIVSTERPNVLAFQRFDRQGLPGASEEFDFIRLASAINVDNRADVASAKFSLGTDSCSRMVMTFLKEGCHQARPAIGQFDNPNRNDIRNVSARCLYLT